MPNAIFNIPCSFTAGSTQYHACPHEPYYIIFIYRWTKWNRSITTTYTASTKLTSGGVASASKPLPKEWPYKCTCVASHRNSRFSAANAQPRSRIPTSSVVTWFNTSATSHSSAAFVVAPSLAPRHWVTTFERTPEKNRLNAGSAGNHSANQRS